MSRILQNPISQNRISTTSVPDRQPAGALRVDVPLALVVLVLATAILVLLIGSLSFPVALHLGLATPASPGLVGLTDPILAMNAEGNVPTWYSSVLLSTSAFLSATIAWRCYTLERQWRAWIALAVLLFYLSLDESVSIHERFGRLTDMVVDPGPIYGWIVVGGILVVLVGLAFLKFVLDQPRRIRNLFILSGALYVGGALGFEIVASLLNHNMGDEYHESVARLVSTHIEEVLEMAGVSTLICALIAHLQRS